MLRTVRVTQGDRPREASEVRRCARCGAAALVCVESWQHRVVGVPTPVWTLNFECQSCHVEVTLHPQHHIRVERLFAFVLLPALFPSVYFFASARRKTRAWTDNPVVPGATAPPIQRGPPARICAACLGLARCSEIALRRTRWVSLGKRFRYTCTACASDFTVHDDRSFVFGFAAATVLSAVGTLIVRFPPGAAVGATQSNRWFGVALLAFAVGAWLMLARWLLARRAHPLALGK